MKGKGVSALKELARRTKATPTAHLPWIPVQHSFLSDQGKRVIIRTGNQFGKTEALCAQLRYRLRGEHPYLPPDFLAKKPIRAIVISPTADHSRKLQRKFHKGIPKHWLDDRTRFDPSIGFRGRVQDCWVKCVHGGVSVVEFHSAAAGGLSLSGDTLDLVIMDEPQKQRIYAECERRLMITGGTLLMGFTPINAPEPLDWLKKLVDEGTISEHHTTMTPEAFVPVGWDEPRRLLDGTPMDEKFIAEQRKQVLSFEAPIVLDGDWETPPEGQAFPAFDHRPGGMHVSQNLAEELAGVDLDLYIGIDHGERDHKQCAVLVGVQGGGRTPRVFVLDQYVGEGLTTHTQDADGIVAMLQRWGLRWNQLQGATGDKPHDVRHIRGSTARKSNADLAAAIAHNRHVNLPAGKLAPPIRQAKKGANTRGRLDYGVRWLHDLQLRGDRDMLDTVHFRVDERCTKLIESLRRWDWKDNEHKDIIDALRYALEPTIMRARRFSTRATLRTE